MSKVEVRVKAGDRWGIEAGRLWQVRGTKERQVIGLGGGIVKVFSYENGFENFSGHIEVFVDQSVARAWIESLGGTVVEEREEEKAVKVVAHVTTTGAVNLSTEGSEVCKSFDVSYRRIHIAGVTT